MPAALRQVHGAKVDDVLMKCTTAESFDSAAILFAFFFRLSDYCTSCTVVSGLVVLSGSVVVCSAPYT